MNSAASKKTSTPFLRERSKPDATSSRIRFVWGEQRLCPIYSQNHEFSIRNGEPFNAALGNGDRILDTDPELPLKVYSRLNGEDHSGLEE